MNAAIHHRPLYPQATILPPSRDARPATARGSTLEKVGSLLDAGHVEKALKLAAVGQLAAGLAHELRNPLTAMRALVEAGREQADGSGLDQRDLQVLDEEIARLERPVDSFLDFARPPRPEKTAMDAHGLVQQALQLAGSRARQREVAIHCVEPAQPVVLEADPAQLRQVLLNVLLNAIDASVPWQEHPGIVLIRQKGNQGRWVPVAQRLTQNTP